MTVPTIIALLLATLTAALIGAGILAAEADHRRALVDSAERMRSASAFLALRDRLDRFLLRSDIGRRLQLVLVRSAITRPLADVVLVVGVGCFALWVIAYDVGGPIFTAFAVVGTVLGLRALLDRRREQRREQFVDQLPELARLLANATQAGLSLRTALSVAADETQDPVRSELRQVNEELALGQRTEDALERLGRRLPSRELAVLVNVLIIQTRAGGQVVTALRGVTDSLEARRDLRREVRTLLAASRATALAVVGLGLLIVWLVQTQVEGGLRGLLGQPLGLVICVVSAGLFTFGLFLVRRFSRVEV
jgi:tight adherence protein B